MRLLPVRVFGFLNQLNCRGRRASSAPYVIIVSLNLRHEIGGRRVYIARGLALRFAFLRRIFTCVEVVSLYSSARRLVASITCQPAVPVDRSPPGRWIVFDVFGAVFLFDRLVACRGGEVVKALKASLKSWGQNGYIYTQREMLCGRPGLILCPYGIGRLWYFVGLAATALLCLGSESCIFYCKPEVVRHGSIIPHRRRHGSRGESTRGPYRSPNRVRTEHMVPRSNVLPIIARSCFKASLVHARQFCAL